jgi:hypothetical protein
MAFLLLMPSGQMASAIFMCNLYYPSGFFAVKHLTGKQNQKLAMTSSGHRPNDTILPKEKKAPRTAQI